MNEAGFLFLIERHITATASEQEEKLFFELLEQTPYKELLEQFILRDLHERAYDDGQTAEVRNRLRSFLEHHVDKEATEAVARRPAGWLKKGHFIRYAAAASAILILTTGLLLYRNRQAPKDAATADRKLTRFGNDVLPGHSGAILSLADGTRIDLDTTANGKIGQQGGSRVIKMNGQVSYRSDGHSTAVGAMVYNSMLTARGNQFMLVLADGTRVWMNAQSSLRFPTAFTGRERVVELTGEAYFEVSRDPSRPFKVLVNKSEVQVLGTNFNINAYPDEPSQRTTLLEGSIRMKKDNRSQLLLPGQQVQLNPDGRTTLIDGADTDRIVAWKNGLFDFSNESLQDIMRQLVRWYDVEVIYQNEAANTKYYTGAIRKQVEISKILNMLELAGGVEFEINGKKVTVLIK
jgi:transmembrane sensor